MKHKGLKITAKVLLSLFFLSTLPYYNTVFYSFVPNKPFSGNVFYNPYQDINREWIKANFHAHSELLLGLTNGDNTMKQMFEKYDSLHYDLPCLSNYNSLTLNHDRDFYTSVYEHGLNLGFTHQLVINSSTASMFDYPFFQFTSGKQYVINKLKTEDNLIALAHPSFKTGYGLDELEVLNNYDLMEVVSPRATSIEHWDKALTSGKIVWAIGNDDSHSNLDEHCGVVWTMINVVKRDNNAVIESLKKGNCYATKGWFGQEMNELKSVTIHDNKYQLELMQNADSITLFSDNGKVVATATNTNKISYNILSENSYVRAEIFETEEWNTYTKMYINPVLRTLNGTIDVSIVKQQISWIKTIFFFTILVLIHLFIIRTIIKW
jgi:glutaredoxin-related protein